MAFVLKQPDQGARGIVQCMGSRLVSGDTSTAVVIGGEPLPANTLIRFVSKTLREVFNDSGPDTFTVGITGDTDALSELGDTDITDVATLFVNNPAGPPATAGGFHLAAAGPVIATVGGANQDGTTGIIDVYVFFTIL